ncbi:putative phosphotransferase [Patulibacter medicamentivorans]|uniref:Putative phosphotransferase n=1 Tax=Patulibacter medicamentivorans TaxID=1097667 RepID=H0E5J8_9ACTN|nr:phosphotransferase family protein [Patulibacter medicamentivorans]EHN11033.1 putative phosphotransferase [Patulibacter medicamentivorans]
MALNNTTDPAVAAGKLTTWLAGKLPDAVDVEVTDLVVPQSSGLSNETILFDGGWTVDGERHQERFVARVAPAGEGVFPTYDLAREFRVLRALGEHSDVPVPRVWWLEEDPAVLGATFIVMSRVDGRVPSDDPPFTAAGWVLDLAPEQRASLHDNALQALAAIHAVDWRAIGLGDLAPAAGTSALDQDIATWTATFEWAAAGDRNPTVEAAYRWIDEHRPAEEGAPVLNWGDARVGNVLFGDDLAAAAVLDWEMVTVGPRELELGWWLFLQRHHTEGIGAPLPEGWPTREQVIARYEQLTGHEVRDIDFYEVWAATRLSSIMHRAGNMMIAAGMLPPDAPMKLNNPASQLLAKLIGFEAPTGEAQSFIGNRG